MAKNNTPLEKEEQELFCRYCESLNIMAINVPNGVLLGSRKNYAYMKMLKNIGFKSGFPDLFLLVKNRSNTKNILFIEMKRQKGGVLSQEQKQWIDWLNLNGYYARVAYGCEHAINILHEYLNT